MKSSPLLQEQVNSLPREPEALYSEHRAAGAGELWPRPWGEGGLDHSEQVQSQRSYYQHGAPCQDDEDERQGSLATQHPRSFLTKVTLGSTDWAVQGSQGPRPCFPICLRAQIFSVTLATVVRSWAASRLQAAAHSPVPHVGETSLTNITGAPSPHRALSVLYSHSPHHNAKRIPSLQVRKLRPETLELRSEGS